MRRHAVTSPAGSKPSPASAPRRLADQDRLLGTRGPGHVAEPLDRVHFSRRYPGGATLPLPWRLNPPADLVLTPLDGDGRTVERVADHVPPRLGGARSRTPTRARGSSTRRPGSSARFRGRRRAASPAGHLRRRRARRPSSARWPTSSSPSPTPTGSRSRPSGSSGCRRSCSSDHGRHRSPASAEGWHPCSGARWPTSWPTAMAGRPRSSPCRATRALRGQPRPRLTPRPRPLRAASSPALGRDVVLARDLAQAPCSRPRATAPAVRHVRRRLRRRRLLAHDAALGQGEDVEGPVELGVGHAGPARARARGWSGPSAIDSLIDLGRLLVADVGVERGADRRATTRRRPGTARRWPRCRRCTCRRTPRLTLASSRIDSSRLRAMTGSITLSSKLPGGPAEGDGGVVADDLGHDLADRLGHDRVHLARHDRRARLQVGEADLGQAGAGPAAHPAEVVGDLVRATTAIVRSCPTPRPARPGRPGPRSGRAPR